MLYAPVLFGRARRARRGRRRSDEMKKEPRTTLGEAQQSCHNRFTKVKLVLS
jgi:hypothetical protein